MTPTDKKPCPQGLGRLTGNKAWRKQAVSRGEEFRFRKPRFERPDTKVEEPSRLQDIFRRTSPPAGILQHKFHTQAGTGPSLTYSETKMW